MHYKFLKKIVGILGYKIIEKNLIKNDRLLSKYSSLNTKKVLEKIFSTNQINFVIQIGSNDGKRFDDLNEFIKKFKPKAIFVEPILSNFNELKKNYSNQQYLIFENLAISVNNEINKLYKVKQSNLNLYDEHVLGITSFNKEHLIKHGIKKKHIDFEKVDSISILELLKKHSVSNFDLLIIDTEGYDSNIVYDFLNNSKIRPVIIFEYIHSKNKDLEKVLELLQEKKYLIVKIEENIFCCPEENLDKFKVI